MNTKLSLNQTENTTPDTAAAAPANPAQPDEPYTATDAASQIRNLQSAIRNAPASPPRPARKSRSDIARLPHAVREMLNHALRDGEDYRIIIARVENLTDKFHGVTPCKLSVWFRTGYQDWLREKQHLENTIAQSDAALTRLARLSKETGADLPDLLQSFLASLLQKTLQDFDPARLNELLAEKPAEIFRLISCLNSHIAVRSRHNLAEIARVRCQVQVAEKAQSAKKEPVPAKNLYEAEMFRQACGSPLQQFKKGLEQRVAEAESKKDPVASKIAEWDAAELPAFLR
jgi:hypothetical protein